MKYDCADTSPYQAPMGVATQTETSVFAAASDGGGGLAADVLELGELTDNIRRLVAAASSASVGGGTRGVCWRDPDSDSEAEGLPMSAGVELELRTRFASGSLSSSESRACFLHSGGVWTTGDILGLCSCLDLFNQT